MIKFQKFILLGFVMLFTAGIISGCAGVRVSRFSYNHSYQLNKPVKDEKCFDASVLLGVDIARAKDIGRKVLIAFDSDIFEESDLKITAQRNRHLGILITNGGEELAIHLKKIAKNKTFATVTTKTGFFGTVGQKAWSCQIADEMVNMTSN